MYSPTKSVEFPFFKNTELSNIEYTHKFKFRTSVPDSTLQIVQQVASWKQVYKASKGSNCRAHRPHFICVRSDRHLLNRCAPSRRGVQKSSLVTDFHASLGDFTGA
jgi:hypothetical protein